MPVPERKRAKATGKGKGHSFLRLPHYLLQSPEWANLGVYAKALLLDLASQYRGQNNGDLCMAMSVLRPRGWRSADTLHKAKGELLAASWIVCTRQGGKHVPSLYAITWEPIDACGGRHDWPVERVASNAWRREACSATRSNSPSIAPPHGAIPEPKSVDCSATRSNQAVFHP